ncbi:Hsp20/alpha crystallin family protein [Novosphingobium album (ex Liu et al. 2023)]|uniref:Hsp20/alpha crystallin family protein n=1 Tax=Novosphingobium album (ex Liu et al. 2023) TaxID=3031130 RepID=A0ABT5WUX0_9SPHN|nr:Hsp20/alpha crystallin family protein [Novosphingobium album (ex Liu et al. 2023)]MDE8653674.1 Hsp20/alpha crystallin family protein [Novosphingobium album (ex Liu et al. 2023)]
MNEQTTISAPHARRAIEVKPEGPIGWLRDEIDRLFDDFSVNRPARGIFAFPGLPRDASPAVELVEKDGGYRLTVEVPGINEKDIDIELAEGVLTISGEKREESETKESGYLISERSYGAFRRQVTLPADIDPDSLEAKVCDGVLRLDMKKDKTAASKTRKIAIS